MSFDWIGPRMAGVPQQHEVASDQLDLRANLKF
jgi:hypothetical protein